MPRDIESFRKLATLGQHLIDLHLLKASRLEVAPTALRHRFEGEGDAVVSTLRYVGGHILCCYFLNFVKFYVKIEKNG